MRSVSSILSVQNLTVSFSSSELFIAVNKLNFDIEKGKTLAIVGESGSGKSLTALALMGLLPKNAIVNGNVSLHANNAVHELNDISDRTWQQLRSKVVSIVFQEPMSSLNPVMKIGEQLREVIATHNKLSNELTKKIAIEWLEKVQLPDPLKIYNKYPHQLSGGQKQRVIIAMAMCNGPALLIADEPTTALDVTVQKEIMHLMQQLQHEHNTAMIFITHDLALAAEIADDIFVMYKGEGIEYGNIQQVLKKPVHPYTKALLACRPVAHQKGKRLPVVADFFNRDEGRVMPRLTDMPEFKAEVKNVPILQVNKLKVWFTESTDWRGNPKEYFKAVDNVSFQLKKGEVLGLVGESGCGKSTLSRSLLGLLPVKEGEILFNGQDLAKISAHEWKMMRRQIQMIFQDPYASLNPRMTIGDMLMEPLLVHGIVPRQGLKHEAQRLLDIVYLPADTFKRYPHQFSGGQRQRIGIARALALRPQLLICDESVSALDVSVQAQILNLLKELQQEFELSYLFISHDLSVVHYISDRLMVMQSGKIIEYGDAEQVFKYPHDPYTRKLVDAMPNLA